MTAEACIDHPQMGAAFRCDGCQSLLCNDCVDESHVLLLCKRCGEMAVPLDQAAAATPPEARASSPILTVQQRKRAALIARPYSFAQALAYPFRGAGLYMYIATLITFAILSLSGGLLGLLFRLAFFAMVVAVQLKIVRTTSEGETELPDWPDFLDIGTMIKDLLTWVVIQIFQWVFIVPLLLFAGASLVAAMVSFDPSVLEPNFGFWLMFVLCFWAGTALSMMAFGAAGNFGRPSVVALHHHIAGFFRGGADAVMATNVIFGFGAALLALEMALEMVPFVGTMLSSVVGTYWLFAAPHLSGLVFRRHFTTLEQMYEG